MKRVECQFESDVFTAAVQFRWPDRVDPSLREHVRNCDICADVAAIAGAIDAAAGDTRASAVLPDSGRVWWLAQLRARREAARTAGHPITAAQLIAFGCSVALLGACFGATSTWFQSTLKAIASVLTGSDTNASLSPLMVEYGILAAGTLVLVLLVPAAVYLAFRHD